MSNPFETATAQASKQFTISYRNEIINVSSAETHRLVWPSGRWIETDCREDFSRVKSSSNYDTRHSIPCSWIILENSGGPDWINKEQLQVIGELIKRKIQN